MFVFIPARAGVSKDTPARAELIKQLASTLDLKMLPEGLLGLLKKWAPGLDV